MGLFQETPWQMVQLPEPVHVEAGKHYDVGIGADGIPYVREVEGTGGTAFPGGGTVTSVGVMVDGRFPPFVEDDDEEADGQDEPQDQGRPDPG